MFFLSVYAKQLADISVCCEYSRQPVCFLRLGMVKVLDYDQEITV